MQGSALHGSWLIGLTVLVALVLSILPLPMEMQWGRPQWLAVVVLYWVMALPHRVGILLAWLTGLLLDLLAGDPIGQNALCMAVVAYLGLLLYQRFRMYAAWQQAGIVFVLIGLYQMIGHWVMTILGHSAPDLRFLLPALVSALLWPWVALLLRYFCRYYDVN